MVLKPNVSLRSTTPIELTFQIVSSVIIFHLRNHDYFAFLHTEANLRSLFSESHCFVVVSLLMEDLFDFYNNYRHVFLPSQLLSKNLGAIPG